MIKVFKAHPMNFTPFSEKDSIKFLQEQGIYIVDEPQECDVFVSITFRTLVKLMPRYGPTKKYLLWTIEPRDNTFFNKKWRGFLWIPNVHIMNIYTGNVWINNYYENSYGKSASIDRILEPLNEINFPDFKHKKIAALMMYRNEQKKWSLKKEGQELDLCYLRTRIGIEGHKLNKMDIYGRDWPDGMSLEISRGRGWTIKGRKMSWAQRKAEILENYHFNLCFENTNFDYYCTEKIWDSIKYQCLPIYYGEGNKIYEDFPKNSFLDYCDFKNPQALFDYIDHMDVEEFRSRMNLCIKVFNDVCKKHEFDKPYEVGMINKSRLLGIVDKLKEITNH